MALTRAMLKGMGLTDDQISVITEAHQESIDGLNRDYKAAKADADRLAQVQKELDELKAGTVGRDEYDRVKKEFDEYKTQIAGEKDLAAKQAAFRALLTGEKIPEKYHDRIIKMTDFSGMEMNGDKLRDEAGHRKSITTEWGEFIATPETKGAEVETPPATNPPAFDAMSLTDKMAFANEHPNDPAVTAWLKK